MKELKRALVSLALLVGCAVSSGADEPESRTSPPRGLGDADGVVGSCFEDDAPSCGGAAAAGNCWCDDECGRWGDCCTDKADACGGVVSDVAPQLCQSAADCAPGLTCDRSVCLTDCTGEEDSCSDTCWGACEAPLPIPFPTPPSPSQPGGDDDDDDAGDDDDDDDRHADVECDCPEGKLCLPLCPVCPEDVPEAACPCTAVCVDG